MAERILGAVLAAGRGSRFGAGDKLRAGLAGQALARHAASAMAAAGFAEAAVVCPAARADLFPGLLRLEAPAGSGQSASLAAAARWAMAAEADLLVIALADMPFVTGADLAEVAA
ncbi:NTP transferase domain-containing protein, partial [Mangrovicoccus algicola]